VSKKDISIVIPVYNEVANVELCLTNLLKFRENSRFNIEIIVIESGSTDGTHELVKSFEKRFREAFRMLYESRPNGKGSACRLGIQESSGDVILIFDADNEYDIGDLPKLVSPILQGETHFTLGSRHSGKPIRNFTQSKLRSVYFNLGHIVFTSYFNLLFHMKLKDPATMWKVFDGNIARNIKFSGKKFDFDWEILCYFIRLGHVPIEYPIKYHSRSPNEGKKIRPIADPLDWLYKITLFRFSKIQLIDKP